MFQKEKNKSRQLMGNQHGISFVTMKTKYVLFFTTFAFHQYIFTPTLFFIFLILLQQRNIHILFHWSRDKPVVVEEGKYDTRVVWWILMFWCMQVMCPNFLLMFSTTKNYYHSNYFQGKEVVNIKQKIIHMRVWKVHSLFLYKRCHTETSETDSNTRKRLRWYLLWFNSNLEDHE